MAAAPAPAQRLMEPGSAQGHSHTPGSDPSEGANPGSSAPAEGGTSGSGTGLLGPGERADAPLAVACLLALPPGEAEAALEQRFAQPGASFAFSRHALLLGLCTSALQVQPSWACAQAQAVNSCDVAVPSRGLTL